MEIKYKILDSIPFLVSEDAKDIDSFIFSCSASDVLYFKGLFEFFSKDRKVLCLSMQDDLNFEAKNNVFALHQFQKQLDDLENQKFALILPVNYLSKIVDKKSNNLPYILKKGEKIDITLFNKKMVEFGYTRTDTVRECGDFANRGEVIDVGLLDFGIRITLDYNVIEKIRKFDFIEQFAEKEVDEIEVFSCFEDSALLSVDKHVSKTYIHAPAMQEINTTSIKQDNLIFVKS